MFLKDKDSWNAIYDVIVVGFGGAGATAARFAADNGAKVLLIDSAPEGHEGGNTRYCGQIVQAGYDFAKLKKYYEQMTAPLDLDEKVLNTFVQGMVDLPTYFEKYLGGKAFSVRKNPGNKNVALLAYMIAEYPEFEGAETNDDLLIHDQIFDSALWKRLRQNVLDRSSQIDVLYEAPAKHLIQDEDKTIIGVQFEQNGKLYNAKANNGVVLTLGGFENNEQMIQDYLGETKLLPYGTLYNNGDGIKMAIEVGADLWHMNNYEPGGPVNIAAPKGQRAHSTMAWKSLFGGSLITVGDDGTRYIAEDDPTRHGHRYNHGIWRIPLAQVHPHMIFDQKKYDEFMNQDNDNFQKESLAKVVKSNTLADLAKEIDVDPAVLKNTIATYNFFVDQGADYQCGRKPESMAKISLTGPFYSLAQQHTMLNTQGGPRRNEKAEVLDTDHQVLPHLYAAGELGHIGANQYNGGGDIADCLIFGKIAGENAAKIKEPVVISGASKSEPIANDDFPASALNETNYETKPNQYIGKSTSGMGNEIIVRVTVNDKKQPTQIEILKESESPDYGGKALKQLQVKMIKEKTADVDAVSGASATSKAFKEAVSAALKQVKQ
ncbi:FAD-binding protein [Lactobacillus sp. ESL0731]|uniref:FAD-binding protein n=1 Tax=unclassified Lactobacillus TaxID=2620435 RepID=UPI0023F7C8D0|nr:MULTISPECIES: FAD-binding protein [unclassified Lactobacillus]WEV50297.1 FAD-binding protein [Lactobacillus sp. ESL0700]WEV61426.1 FAD-binding protein [Lactobacillus sp. ESL0731]